MTTIKQSRPRTMYKYIAGIEEGKFYFLGPYSDDPNEEAESVAHEKFSSPDSWEIVKLKYYGQSNALHAVRHKRLLQNQTLQEASQRVHHKKGETNE